MICVYSVHLSEPLMEERGQVKPPGYLSLRLGCRGRSVCRGSAHEFRLCNALSLEESDSESVCQGLEVLRKCRSCVKRLCPQYTICRIEWMMSVWMSCFRLYFSTTTAAGGRRIYTLESSFLYPNFVLYKCLLSFYFRFRVYFGSSAMRQSSGRKLSVR